MSFEFLKIDSQFLEIVTKHPTRFFYKPVFKYYW
jgi:hypothetical protein